MVNNDSRIHNSKVFVGFDWNPRVAWLLLKELEETVDVSISWVGNRVGLVTVLEEFDGGEGLDFNSWDLKYFNFCFTSFPVESHLAITMFGLTANFLANSS